LAVDTSIVSTTVPFVVESTGNSPVFIQTSRETRVKGLIFRLRLLVWAGIAVVATAGTGLIAQGQGPGGQQVPELPPPINESSDPLLKPFVWRSIGG
jgi:hypothetical protein